MGRIGHDNGIKSVAFFTCGAFLSTREHSYVSRDRLSFLTVPLESAALTEAERD